MSEFKEIFKVADILLPSDSSGVDFSSYPVIACDQHTGEPEYWHEVEKITDGSPSTLDMIVPEVYLEESEERIHRVHAAMRQYEDTFLREYRNTVVFCERAQADGRIRRGAICALDLECYDYVDGTDAPVRATEGTVLSRIPARVAVRREASLELPHVMLLIDDPDKSIIEPEFTHLKNMRLLYDTDLMLGGGHITGYACENRSASFFLSRLNNLASSGSNGRFAVAVGDGNHSLASAKAWYEELKEIIGAEAASIHPARYALVEIVNIYSSALDFEPIHRIVYGTDIDAIVESSVKYTKSIGAENTFKMDVVSSGRKAQLVLPANRTLSVAALTEFLDLLLSNNSALSVDYIHGDETVARLAVCGAVGIFCDKMDKRSLFDAVAKDGALPRKTFSMGHACDKRYYMEARKITY